MDVAAAGYLRYLGNLDSVRWIEVLSQAQLLWVARYARYATTVSAMWQPLRIVKQIPTFRRPWWQVLRDELQVLFARLHGNPAARTGLFLTKSSPALRLKLPKEKKRQGLGRKYQKFQGNAIDVSEEPFPVTRVTGALAWNVWLGAR